MRLRRARGIPGSVTGPSLVRDRGPHPHRGQWTADDGAVGADDGPGAVRLLNVVAEQHHPVSDGVHLRMGTYAGDGAAEVVTKKASAQAGAEQPLDHLRVGFAVGRPDHLADEEPQQAGLAGAVLVHLVRVGSQHLVDDRGDRGLIADLGQTALGDDLSRVAASLDHLGKDVLGRRSGDLARLDSQYQRGKSRTR